jgi:predicted nucleotidyltransferase
MHNVPLDKALQRLLSSQILKKEKKYYSLNFENQKAKSIVEIASTQYKQLRELHLNVFYLIVDALFELSLIKGIEIYFFGSYAKLVYKENSDIDIAILYPKEIPKTISKITTNLEKTYHKKIEIHYFKKQEFNKNKKDPLVKSILKEGIHLKKEL